MPADQSIPCFTAGTIIATREGKTRIEDLHPCDHVVTLDSGFSNSSNQPAKLFASRTAPEH